MASISSQLSHKSWTKDRFYISTDTSLIPIPQLSAIFASKEFYWANALPPPVMEEMLKNSLTFGLFEIDATTDEADTSDRNPKLKFIGIARCVTDFISFLYLTDVWVDAGYQGHGLGTWLVQCVQEVVEGMPHLRRSLLFTADWERSVPFYRKLMGMEVIETRPGEGLAVMERKGRGHPSFGVEGSGYR